MKTKKYLLVTNQKGSEEKKSYIYNHWLDMLHALAILIDKGETVAVKMIDQNITDDDRS